MVELGKEECTQCGICEESCIVVKSGKHSIASELNGKSQRGAWNCVNCWKCMEACPQEVDIYSLMMARRREEDIPLPIRQSINNIMRTGCVMKRRGINEIRKMSGLKPLRWLEEHEVKTLLDSDS